jgi:hypothetical protein
MDETECGFCDEPLDDLQCHHHHTEENTETIGITYVMCQDCPAWWPVTTVEV